MLEQNRRIQGHAFEFEVPQRPLQLPRTLKDQVKIQASLCFEDFLAKKLSRYHDLKSDGAPAWAEKMFKYSNPSTGQMTHSGTKSLFSASRSEPGFLAHWDRFRPEEDPAVVGLTALRLSMKRNYPLFLKQHGLEDSQASVNAYVLLVLKQYYHSVQEINKTIVEPNIGRLEKYKGHLNPMHDYIEQLNQRLYLSVPGIGFSEHAGFGNQLIKFLEDHQQLLAYAANPEGRQFFEYFPDRPFSEEFKSAVRMHDALTPLGLQ